MRTFLEKLMDFSQANWKTALGFAFFLTVLFSGESGSQYLEPLFSPAMAERIAKYSKMIVSAVGLWKLYSPNWNPPGAPEKP